MHKVRRYLPFVLVGLVAFFVGGLAWSGGISDRPLHAADHTDNTTTTTNPAKQADPSSALSIAEAVDQATEQAVNQARSAVVLIKTTFPAQQAQTQGNPFNDPFFGQFFGPWFGGQFQQQPQQEIGFGSGFIVDQDGHILTNEHVVGTADQNAQIQVKLPGQSDWIDAKLLGSDYNLDLAVIQIKKPADLKSFPTVPLGNSDQEQVGERVIAVGNPYGDQFANTVTTGVLSAKGRKITVQDDQNGQARPYTNLMQTDAAINPGNSGGPLLNIKGQVIGINTAVSTRGQGIGFAIPINAAIAVKNELITKGHVVRPYMGVRLGDLTAQEQHLLGISGGALVGQVEPGTPAEKAGLQQWDVIIKIDDTKVASVNDLTDLLTHYHPGDTIKVTVVRNNQQKVLSLKLGTTPDAPTKKG